MRTVSCLSASLFFLSTTSSSGAPGGVHCLLRGASYLLNWRTGTRSPSPVSISFVSISFRGLAHCRWERGERRNGFPRRRNSKAVSDRYGSTADTKTKLFHLSHCQVVFTICFFCAPTWLCTLLSLDARQGDDAEDETRVPDHRVIDE